MSGEAARRALADLQPLAQEALGWHAQRQTLLDGELPAYIVMTRPETNGGWGELMPVWFQAHARPVPLYCLDNWALFAALYRASFGPGELDCFTSDSLLRVVLGADLLMPFLPGTTGAGRFVRHGMLPLLLSILWLEAPVRDAWLSLHMRGARAAISSGALPAGAGGVALAAWLDRVEDEAWLVPEMGLVAGDAAVGAFLDDRRRVRPYAALFSTICVMISALVAAWGVDWRRWVFQAVNVGYRSPEFALPELAAWLA
jgi:hypothetical protein